MQSNKDHALYSDFINSKPKCKPEGYHTVCVRSCHSGSSCVVIRHQAVINVGLIADCSFSESVPLQGYRRRRGRRPITSCSSGQRRAHLSTTSLTLFEVLLSMIVLPVTQVLHQFSEGMTSAAKGASAANNTACVCVA
jgi:hypothetical protein